MQLCEDDEVKVLSIYKENRGGRCNFAELKCVHSAQADHELEDHLFRNLKVHLGNLRYSYLLSWVHKDFVGKYNALDFFAIKHELLPDDVKVLMPYKEDYICMKHLLRDWDKNRFDLLYKPFGYPASVAGDAMRETIRKAKSSLGIEELRK